MLGLGVFGSGGVGWLLGPFVGNAVFGVRYRGLRGEIERVSWGDSLFFFSMGGGYFI